MRERSHVFFFLPYLNSICFLFKKGCGKTTLVQRLANLTGRKLIVQNLSLQTDSTDLLGGYKPLEMRHVARGVYDKFVDLFVSSFSRSQNAQFLSYVLTSFEKNDWKKLAQCFLRAANMGENKVSQRNHHRSLRYATIASKLCQSTLIRCVKVVAVEMATKAYTLGPIFDWQLNALNAKD